MNKENYLFMLRKFVCQEQDFKRAEDAINQASPDQLACLSTLRLINPEDLAVKFWFLGGIAQFYLGNKKAGFIDLSAIIACLICLIFTGLFVVLSDAHMNGYLIAGVFFGLVAISLAIYFFSRQLYLAFKASQLASKRNLEIILAHLASC